MVWKIKNISKSDVKIAIADSNVRTVGLLLKPGQFCICKAQQTTSTHLQEQRRFIQIDKNYKNEYKLDTCKAYEEKVLNSAIDNAKAYTADIHEDEHPQDSVEF